MALVTILLYFHCTRVHSRFIFKNTMEQISIFDETGNQIRTKIRALKLLANYTRIRITVIAL